MIITKTHYFVYDVRGPLFTFVLSIIVTSQ